MVKKRVFSLYDIEQFLKDAGAAKVTEKAAISLERELQDTVNGLVSEATFYANYAGRKRTINNSDLALARNVGNGKGRLVSKRGKPRHIRKDGIRKSSAMQEFIDPRVITLRAVQGTSSQMQEPQILYI